MEDLQAVIVAFAGIGALAYLFRKWLFPQKKKKEGCDKCH